MIKKRLIFTLLYNEGYFMLSRNFRLQRVGNLHWLNTHYNFSRVANSIDELMILDVTRNGRNLGKFCDTVKKLSEKCFIPIAAGGGIRDINAARQLLQSGADKVVLNTGLFAGDNLQGTMSREFGQQCVVASIDIKRSANDGWSVWTNNGEECQTKDSRDLVAQVLDSNVGEIYLNSMDRDGTGQGLDLETLDLIPSYINKPVIAAGGAGNVAHLFDALQDNRVDAVATANLFNFVGDGLQKARETLVAQGVDLAMWEPLQIQTEKLSVSD